MMMTNIRDIITKVGSVIGISPSDASSNNCSQRDVLHSSNINSLLHAKKKAEGGESKEEE